MSVSGKNEGDKYRVKNNVSIWSIEKFMELLLKFLLKNS